MTHRITSGAQLYLKDRGFKPIETEVTVVQGWQSDLAAVVVPTDTELQYMKLIPKKPAYGFQCDYLRDRYGSEYWKSDEFKKLQEKKQEELNAWKKLADAVPSPLTAIVEVKVTRGDFFRDDKWTRPSPVNLRYLAMPAAMIKRSEYPVGWFVLEFGADGKLLRVPQQGTIELPSIDRQMWTIHEIAVRRHHRTEHVWIKDVNKRLSAEQTVQKQNMRVSNVLSAVLDIVKGGDEYYKTPEDVLRARRIKYDTLPYYQKEEIKRLWGIGKKSESNVNPNLRSLVEGM